MDRTSGAVTGSILSKALDVQCAGTAGIDACRPARWFSRLSLHNLFIDFDAFFTSVEQQLQPQLRKRLIMADTMWCIAACYEAKRFGIKTATCVADARWQCPELVCMTARHQHYVGYHHRLIHHRKLYSRRYGDVHRRDGLHADRGLVRTCVCQNQGHRDQEHHRGPGRRILTCSIGIASNRFLAEIASDMAKPNGLIIIDSWDLPQALYGLALSDLYGIGNRMLKRLPACGIDSVPALSL
jgi:DNA polymerase-4